MKYLIFNIVVAGALIYLALGGDITWPGGDEEKPVAATASEAVPTQPSMEETLARLKPAIEETATIVAEQVAEDVASQVGRQHEDDPLPPPAQMEDQARTDLPPLPEIAVETPETHRPQESLPTDVAAAPQVQLAEGAQMMSPRDRQRELDALVQDMELMFLDKAGQ